MATPAQSTSVVPVITPDQARLIDAMKAKVVSVMKPKRHSDEYLLRFLKAREMNVDKASEMFITSMNWRRDNNVDQILQTFPTSPYFKTLMNYWPSTYLGELVSGYKVFYERLGDVEVKNLLRAIPLDALVSYHIYILESQERERRRQIKARGYSLPFINIQDCDGLGMKHAYTPGIEFLRSLTKIDEANYPEMVHQIFFINTPSVFNVLYKLVAPFVPQTTIDKVRLNKDELLSLLPPERVPPHLGGKATVSIKAGGPIEDKDVFNGKRLTVAAGATHLDHFFIDMPGSTLHVHFSTEGNDIGFTLLYKKTVSDEEARTLVPNKRYDSHNIAAHVEFVVQEPGVYVASWDNTFSKWTSKPLYYHIVEVTPVQQAQIIDEVLRNDPVMHNANGFLLPKANK
jgi:hypothetical protein